MRFLHCSLPILLALGTVSPAAADAALIARAFTAPPAGGGYAYEFIDRSRGESDEIVTRGRIDPAKPKGQRVTILESSDSKADLRKVDERYESRMMGGGEIWCDRLISGADGPVTEKPAEAGLRKFVFRPLAPQGASNDEKKLYRNMTAEALIDPATGQLRRLNARLEKPYRPLPIAKLDVFELSYDCRPGPGGRPYSAAMEMSMKASAVGAGFARNVSQTVVRLIPSN
jgi:hypothetical protein